MAASEQPPQRRRERQTRRTRAALIAAADELFAEGRVPTVSEVAERADVGRATAYRYFPTQEALLVESTFLGDQDPLRALPELAEAVEDPAERMAEAVRSGAEWTLGREARLRTILRASLDAHSDTTRPGRRRAWIARLLESVKDELPPTTYERLSGSLTLLFGIDPIVSIADNSDIDREAIPDVLAWAALNLVRAALAEAGCRPGTGSGASAMPPAERLRRP
jgi:AcrR family transcriptional regulator